MAAGSLLIGSPDWTWPAVVMAVGAVGLVAWAYIRISSGQKVRWLASGIKLVAFLLLVLCLIEPLWNGSRAVPGANTFIMLADNSRGMTIQDRGEDESRGELLKQQLNTTETPWQVRLHQDFAVRGYQFDSRLHGVRDFASLSFDGTGTALQGSLSTIEARYRSRPVAGILLFTDGNATDIDEASLRLDGLPPVYPVICGADNPPHDLSIRNVTVSQTAFEDAPISLRVEVHARGYAGEELTVELRNESAEQLKMLDHSATENDQILVFRFDIQQSAPGVSFYEVRVARRGQLATLGDDEAESDEATLDNNSRWVMADRGKGSHRVLYVAGRPNWEYKFLRRSLDGEDQIDLVAMIRVAKREAKFSFRAKSDGSTNPLFEDFLKGEKREDDTEQFDEAVIVRLNTKDDSELRDGFPQSRKELYQYKAIVIDDLEASFFDRDQMTLLRRFVSERGGGILLLGGQESFRQGGYNKTPIEELMPVYIDRAPSSRSGERLRLDLTRDGWLQPWVRLRRNEVAEKKRLGSMPDFLTVNRVRGVKPGANVLATVSDQTGSFPALVAQRFGRGRSCALMVGDMWRWALREDDTGKRDLDKSWRQLMRWLVADVPDQVSIRTVRTTEDFAEMVTLEVKVRNDEFDPVDNASVELSVKTPQGTDVALQAEGSLEEPGLFVATYSARLAGCYRARARVRFDQQQDPIIAETGWTSNPAAREFQSLVPNRSLMAKVAEKTGGELIEISELPELVSSLPMRQSPITEQFAYPIWHRGSVFLLALGCMLSEWGLRRWRGLP